MKSVTVTESITISPKSEEKTILALTRAERVVWVKEESWTTQNKMKTTRAVGVAAASKTSLNK